MPGEIHTQRLLLRLATTGDIESLARAAQAADTSRIARVVAGQDQCWQQHGYGLWALSLYGTLSVIGWCGLKPGADPTHPEIMFGLEPESWRRGSATEAARAVIAFALALPGVSSVWGATATTNAASAAVMQRAGMLFEHEGPLDGVPSRIFRIHRELAAGESAASAE